MNLVEAVLGTYGTVGQDVKDITVRMIVTELQNYPEADVEVALSRCRKELRKITLADILERLPISASDLHPGGQVAWARLAAMLNNEQLTVCWTDEMADAFGVALGLADDPIAARMAFLEAYTGLVDRAKAEGRSPQWRISLGTDVYGREPVIAEAVKQGLIDYEYGQRLYPELSLPDARVMDLTKGIGN